MADWLQRQWYRISIWHLVLIPISWVFGLVIILRREAYRIGWLASCKLPIPVIVVGNITVGGTGKTPLVVWLAQQLQAMGFHPGIISRGYGAEHRQPMPVHADSDARALGDEPVLIAMRTGLPVWVCRDRVASARALRQAHPACDVIISDDGLQHYRLQRDVEIAVIDGQRLFGNRQLLPAGPLREPPSRLKEVDAIVCNGGFSPADGHVYDMRLNAGSFRQVRNPARTASASDLEQKTLLAIAGIGHPERFFAQLREMQLVFESRAFPDHHPYVAEDLQAQGVDAILMTEKDAVKCRGFAQDHWWYLPVDAAIEDGLLRQILPKLRN